MGRLIRSFWLRGFAAVAGVVLMLAPAYAEVPSLINYQGYLADNSASPLSGSYDLTFSIYDAPAGGTLLWTETQLGVTVIDGLFVVLLGAASPLNDGIFDGTARYLGITIGADPELTPRQQITSVAFAFRIGTIDGASGGNISSTTSIGSSHAVNGINSLVVGESHNLEADHATIAGGFGNTVTGGLAFVGAGSGAKAAGTFSAVVGGVDGITYGSQAFVGAGDANIATGTGSFIGAGGYNQTLGEYSFVGAGGDASSNAGNTASGNQSAVVAGMNNEASGLNSFVGGGRYNFARGDYSTVAGGGAASESDSNSAQGSRSTISGGRGNVARQNYATVSGGSTNTASGTGAVVGGGVQNQALANQSTIAGGTGNIASSSSAFVGGGTFNNASNVNAVIAGGHLNEATALYTVVGGGVTNKASGDYAVVAGGRGNRAIGLGAFIGGGGMVGESADSNTASGELAVVVGGHSNESAGLTSFIGGGARNQSSSMFASVTGGQGNLAAGVGSFVGGGYFNQASGHGSVVGGGGGLNGVPNANVASGDYATIAGGQGCTAAGDYASVPGGFGNDAAGIYSFAAGVGAHALHNGTFVWNGFGGSFDSQKPNTFIINSPEGVGIQTDNPQAPLHVKSAPGSGNEILRLEMERTWAFRQFSSSANTSLELASLTAGNKDFLISTEGNVGIGTTAPSQKLHVAGNICATGSIGACSDGRYKTDVRTLNGSLDKISGLRGVAYRWIRDEFPNQHFDDKEHVGFIAQEIEELIPEVVMTDAEGYMSVDYGRLTPLLVESIKELRQQVDSQDEKILKLHATIEHLNKKLEQYSAHLEL